ncbi:hypothetical protein PDESU_06284 [Pontiella desulfatans]|uniref:Plasmid related protein n=1 Tax=Pontiella desulfatans TaxID=2750659 RepID=A0A6C2UBY4_PONDE|nr:hypothetical protein [Pontiella desulfatans]VGO17682.1 hypothetical protein PDESU_06284 [Pontiella desulfatans]
MSESNVLDGRALKKVRLFALGRLVATPGALAALEENGKGCTEYLERHVRGEWGDLCDEDKLANDEAVAAGLRILSAYRLPDGERLWAITEADRSVTTILLPAEY